jgi:hypothetical protein
MAAQWWFVQIIGAPADYYREWWNYERWLEKNIFLPQLNLIKDSKFAN